jgi:hypothetical protein
MPVAIDEMEVESAPAPNQSSSTPRASKTRPRKSNAPRTRRERPNEWERIKKRWPLD